MNQINRHPKDSPNMAQKKKEKKISVAKTRALWENMGMTQNVEEAMGPRKSRATRKEPGGF